MALDVYFAVDAKRRIASAVALTIETARASGPLNRDFLAGVLALARAEALAYGLSWADVIADVRSATGRGNYALLPELERALTG